MSKEAPFLDEENPLPRQILFGSQSEPETHEEIIREALEYRLSEVNYYIAMHKLLADTPVAMDEFMGQRFFVDQDSYEKYLIQFGGSLELRDMQRIIKRNNLVIGGAEGTNGALMYRTYKKNFHMPIFRTFEMPKPEYGDQLLTATSEIGYMKQEKYAQIFPPIYCVPNSNGEVDPAVYEIIFQTSERMLNEIG